MLNIYAFLITHIYSRILIVVIPFGENLLIITYRSKITKLQRPACKVIVEAEYTNLESARSRLIILSFDQAVFLNKAKVMYKVVKVIAPQYIRDLFQLRADTLTNNSLRSVSNNNFTISMPRASLFKDSLSGPVIWTAILSDVKNALTINNFTRKIINLIRDA